MWAVIAVAFCERAAVAFCVDCEVRVRFAPFASTHPPHIVSVCRGSSWVMSNPVGCQIVDMQQDANGASTQPVPFVHCIESVPQDEQCAAAAIVGRNDTMHCVPDSVTLTVSNVSCDRPDHVL